MIHIKLKTYIFVKYKYKVSIIIRENSDLKENPLTKILGYSITTKANFHEKTYGHHVFFLCTLK